MWCVCQSCCYYITIPNPSHPLRYFKDVYKPASIAQRLWLKGCGNLLRIGHRCGLLISKTDPFPEIPIHENHRPYYQQAILVYFKLRIRKYQKSSVRHEDWQRVSLSYSAVNFIIRKESGPSLLYADINRRKLSSTLGGYMQSRNY